MRRNHRPGMKPLSAGLLAILILAIGVFFAFTKRVPCQHHYTLHAVVTNSNLLMPNSPVRIGGVAVGQVSKGGRDKATTLADGTMQIDKVGQPIHRDATLK